MNAVHAVDPGDFERIVGRAFVKHERYPLLVIGRTQYNRWNLGRLGCPHPVAASNLNRVIRQLGITTLPSLARHVPQLGRYKGLGVTAYWIVLAILRDAGYDVEKAHGEDVTYQTVKARALRTLGKRRRSGHAPRAHAADTAHKDQS